MGASPSFIEAVFCVRSRCNLIGRITLPGARISRFPGIVAISATVVQDTVQLSTNAVQIQVDWASEFSIAGISFTDWNDNPVAGLKPGEIVQARVTVRNHTDQAKEAVLIVALYDKSGRMVNVSLLSREFGKESEDTIRAGFRLPDSTDGYMVKAMVWDDVSTMTRSPRL